MAVGTLLIAVGALCAWAVLTVLRPADDPLEAAGFTYVDVVEGEVGASIMLNAVAEWTPILIGTNRTAGIVTDVAVKAGARVSQGSRLYSVDSYPVVVAQGNTPAFRAIDEGTEGADVAQLQGMLSTLGFYSGDADGKAQEGTVRAIRAWQGSLGIEKTGIVNIGDIIFVPSLPMNITLDAKIIRRGASLMGGEDVLQGLPPSPEFSITITDAQAAMIPTGTAVEVTSPEGGLWKGSVADLVRDAESGTTTARLRDDDGAVICADACGQIPVTGSATLTAEIITVETVSGLIVPSSALVTDAHGRVSIITDDDERIDVIVQASAKGISVISGAKVGLSVRVPGTDAE